MKRLTKKDSSGVRTSTQGRLFFGPLFLALACVAPSPTAPSNHGGADSSSASTPTPPAPPTSSLVENSTPSGPQPVACRPARVDQGCRAGSPKRPVRQTGRTPAPTHHATDEAIFSTNGRAVFYYRQRTAFDFQSFAYAAAVDCPLWEDVFAWDKHDVYVLEPQSCGGENCGADYTGYSWGGMGVRAPLAFHWLPGSYGSDGRFVYNRWHEGPLERAQPATFQVLLCGDEHDGFVVGQDGDRFYLDGKVVTKAEAFTPSR